MYVQTSESPEQVLTRLRCSNVNELEELRMLIKGGVEEENESGTERGY